MKYKWLIAVVLLACLLTAEAHDKKVNYSTKVRVEKVLEVIG